MPFFFGSPGQAGGSAGKSNSVPSGWYNTLVPNKPTPKGRNVSKALSTAGQQYLAALEAQAAAEKAVAVAKELLTEAVAEAGVNEVAVNGKKIMLVTAVRRNFLVDKLKELVSAKTYEAVTKTAVEPKAFDKALKAGEITADIEEAVVNPTPYTRIVVSDEKAKEEAVAV